MSNIHTEVDNAFDEFEKINHRFLMICTDSHILDAESLYAMRDTLQEMTKLMKKYEEQY
jgi:hypothetical protein